MVGYLQSTSQSRSLLANSQDTHKQRSFKKKKTVLPLQSPFVEFGGKQLDLSHLLSPLELTSPQKTNQNSL